LNKLVRYVLASLGLLALACASVAVARDGWSSFLIRQSDDELSLSNVNEAIGLNPINADSYHARASIYQRQGRGSEAIKDLERAVSLRPGDHFLWLELGFARYQAQDIVGALADFRESVRLAPFYAQPHWYLGHTLLDTGKPDEGFAEVRKAVASNPEYLTDAIKLADEVYSGDPGSMFQAIKPQTSAGRLAVIVYFLQRQDLSSAMLLFRQLKNEISSNDRLTLAATLFRAKNFPEAYEVWSMARSATRGNDETAPITNADFEEPVFPASGTFDWTVTPGLQRVAVERDAVRPESGAYCLRLSFKGNSTPSTEVVSQTLLVQEQANYELDFSYRSDNLVSGGTPIVVVTDADRNEILASSQALPANEINWQRKAIRFSTKNTRAVTIMIKRTSCAASPCPAFGTVWFDNFICFVRRI
jgi:tetratricopeptide (TPR) repeat protein